MIRQAKVLMKHPGALLWMGGGVTGMMAYVYEKRAEKMRKLKAESMLYGGFKLNLDPGDGAVSGRLFEEGEWEPDEMRVFLPLLDEGKVVFDIGANIGVYSLVACSKGCEVHAFEPNPRPFALLWKSMADNGFHAALNQKALSDADDEVMLFVPQGPNGGLASLMSNMPARSDTTLSALCTTLDDYLDEKHIEKIDVMKIDAEGAEERIILGASSAIGSGRVQHIIMEMSLPMWHKNSPAAKLLEEQYRIGIIKGSSIEPIESVFDVKKPWVTSLYLRSKLR